MGLLSDDIVTIILTFTGIITGTGYGLQKLGLLHFGKERQQSSSQCALHTEFQKAVMHIKETQRLNIQRHEQSERSLEIGEKKFDTLQETVSDLKEGIGILMDRTGGRPTDWRGKKRQ